MEMTDDDTNSLLWHFQPHSIFRTKIEVVIGDQCDVYFKAVFKKLHMQHQSQKYKNYLRFCKEHDEIRTQNSRHVIYSLRFLI